MGLSLAQAPTSTGAAGGALGGRSAHIGCDAQLEDHPMITSKKAKLNESSKSSPKKAGRRNVAATKKALQRKKEGTAQPNTAEVPHSPPRNSKQQLCLALLRRPKGASVEELQKGTGWQVHSVRGFLSGVVKRKLGLTVLSEKVEGSSRRYRIASLATS
jgi:hypothetical protein